ncbi:hypothetical protein AVDCRST_MAG92-4417 [uncultured Coleofasciculus sp.]|uniref:Uncharacterized protein n=1 Tax=uncultured Coleofasciculus sp. TaxID=1267456 RepID=A0A6J4JZY0_9CYAN|nr:hypothetical protein AVDCRST_MAG92-4417 [uncultured Coleofasciculus sp.]
MGTSFSYFSQFSAASWEIGITTGNLFSGSVVTTLFQGLTLP